MGSTTAPWPFTFPGTRGFYKAHGLPGWTVYRARVHREGEQGWQDAGLAVERDAG